MALRLVQALLFPTPPPCTQDEDFGAAAIGHYNEKANYNRQNFRMQHSYSTRVERHWSEGFFD
jgi:hypothetical protein